MLDLGEWSMRRKVVSLSGVIVFLVISLQAILPISLCLGAADTQEMLKLFEIIQREKERKDQAIIRPHPLERTAVQNILKQSPPPPTLNQADQQFLKGLLDKVVWTGLERRVMHAIYQEIYGSELNLSDSHQEKNEQN